MSSHIKKIVALVLSFTMIFTSGALTVFAGGAAAQEPEETYNIVTFGDSMTSGYGTQEFWNQSTELGGFDHVTEFAYPNSIKDYLQKIVKKTVKVTKMNFEGMMVSDVNIMLAENGKDLYKEETKIVSKNTYYKDHHWSHLKSWTAQSNRWKEDGNPVKLYNDTVDETPDRINTIRSFTQERVKDADMVIIDNLNSSFGIYEVQRLMKILEYKDKIDQFQESGYANYVEDLTSSAALKKVAKDVRSKVNGLELDDLPLPMPVITELVDSLVYTTVESVLSVANTVKSIKALNPDAKIVIVGPQNPIESMNIKASGVTIPLGKVIGTIFSAFGTYFKYMGLGANDYYYVDILNGQKIESLAQKWGSYIGDDINDICKDENADKYLEILTVLSAKTGKSPEITIKALESARNNYAGQGVNWTNNNPITNGQELSKLQKKQLAQILFAQDLSGDAQQMTGALKVYGVSNVLAQNVAPSIDQAVKNIIYASAHPVFDISALIDGGLGSFSSIAASLAEVLTTQNFVGDVGGTDADGTALHEMDKRDQTLLSLFVLAMMENGAGGHPSKEGCITKAKMVEAVAEKAIKEQKAPKSQKYKYYNDFHSVFESIVEKTAVRIAQVARYGAKSNLIDSTVKTIVRISYDNAKVIADKSSILDRIQKTIKKLGQFVPALN